VGVGLPSAAAADHHGASLLRPSSEISKDDEGGKSTFVFSNLSSWYSPLYPIASTSPYKTRQNNRVTCHCHLVGWLWSLDRKIERG
jgi:hypothetical protein